MTTTVLLSFVFPFLLTLPSAHAAPFLDLKQLETTSTLHVRRNQTDSSSSNSNNNNTLSPQIWAPLLGIAAVILIMLLISCLKRRRLDAALLAARQANGASGNGSTNGDATTTARRARRQRRTASQISTRSLPAYMEDPSEMEVVLGRGRPARGDRMEPMEEVAEHAGDVDVTDAQSPLLTYPPVPLPVLAPEPGHRPSGSFDSMRLGSETSGDALLRRTLSSEVLRSLGDAPPYESSSMSSEMVELGTGVTRSPSATRTPQIQLTDASTTAAAAPTPTESASATTEDRRRSGFRRIISRFMPASSAAPNANPSANLNPSDNPFASRIHTRTGSNATVATTRSHTQSHHPRSRSQSNLPSRPSTHSLSLFHLSRSTLSLNHLSNQSGLPNPSTNLSTTSISAPLAHTLVRTNFVYPSSGLGLSDEQIKFISSVETVGKYGVPYGEQAVMARSREVLGAEGEEPPPFEAIGQVSASSPSQNEDQDQGDRLATDETRDEEESGTRTIMAQPTLDLSSVPAQSDAAGLSSSLSPMATETSPTATIGTTPITITTTVQARPLLRSPSLSMPVPMSASTIQTFHTARDEDRDETVEDKDGGKVSEGELRIDTLREGNTALLDSTSRSPIFRLRLQGEDEDDLETPTQLRSHREGEPSQTPEVDELSLRKDMSAPILASPSPSVTP